MPFANVGPRRIHYETFGDEAAPPLLLIMGLSFSSGAWDTLPGMLSGRFRVVIFDNAGTGRSDPPARRLSMATMADDALAVLDAERIPRAHVFGISMGGMIALHLVLRHPERVAGLALGCTFAGWLRSTKPSLAIQREVLVASSRARTGGDLSGLARILVSPAFLASPETGLPAFAAFLKRAEVVPPRMARRQMAAILFHSTDSRLGLIGAPTLVITGDGDRLVPIENSRKLARRIPGARLVELPGLGHCFPLEDASLAARHLTEFFESHQARIDPATTPPGGLGAAASGPQTRVR